MARRKNRGNEKGQAIAKLIMEQYQHQNKEEMHWSFVIYQPYNIPAQNLI